MTETISSFTSISVTLGSAAYPGPLTVASTGTITPAKAGAPGVFAPQSISNASLQNYGQIVCDTGSHAGGIAVDFLGGGTLVNGSSGIMIGGTGSNTNKASFAGGAGVYMHGGSAANSGYIYGGAGGYGYGNAAGSGGIGLDLTNGGTLNNTGSIIGGSGGYGSGSDGSFFENGGAGGAGASLSGGVSINAGTIIGGHGGNGYDGGDGSTGVDLTAGARLTNSGTIIGGFGGYGYQRAGNSGAGVSLTGASLTNSAGGVISGGGGGNANLFGSSGAAGVTLSSATLTNAGSIAGGQGGSAGETNGAGGIGVYAGAGSSLVSSGSITGGAGYAGGNAAGSVGGIGLDLSAGASAMNSGSITGGLGGNGAYNVNAGDGYAGGNGGAGAVVGAGVTLTNTGTIGGGGGGIGGDGAKGHIGGAGGAGGAGVYLNGGTLVTSGTITGGIGGAAGTGGTAGAGGESVQFGTIASTLVVERGAHFTAKLIANASVNDVLDLGGSAPGVTGAIGTLYRGFTTVEDSAGSRWQLAGSNDFAKHASLDVAGSLTVVGSVSNVAAVTVEVAAGRAGLLRLTGTGTLQTGSLALAGGTLKVASGAEAVIGIGTAAGAGSITVEAGGVLTGEGELSATSIVDNGNIVAEGGTLTLAAPTSGTGTVQLDSSSTVQAFGSLAASIAFMAGGQELLFVAHGASVTGTISGFGAGDTIDLRVAASHLQFSDGVLDFLAGKGTVVAALSFAGPYTQANFHLASDGHGGSDVTYISTSAADMWRETSSWRHG
jgi:hypothetical protein